MEKELFWVWIMMRNEVGREEFGKGRKGVNLDRGSVKGGMIWEGRSL